MEPISTVYAGRLGDDVWPGSIGVGADGGRPDAVQSWIEGLEQYFVPVDPTAPSRCIDGRHDPSAGDRLGAQAPGGAPGAALAHRLGVDRDDLTRGTFTADAEAMVETYLRLGLAPGGHRDAAADGEQSVGCGAIDGLDAVLESLLDPSLVEDHKRLVRLLLGEAFDRDHYLRILGAGLVLRSRSTAYFTGRGDILDLLERKAPGSVVVLDGTHQEQLVVVNLVPGTTLASNRFTEGHGGTQAFGYDLWRSRELAGALFPLPSQQVDRERFVHARVMLTIATLMALTDGSLPLLVRFPNPGADPDASTGEPRA